MKRDQRGFTLLEVMVAVAILGLGLTTIFAAQAGAFASAGHARNLSQATGLARCRMSEVEEALHKDGFQTLDVNEVGPCCDGEEDGRFSCAWRIEKLELPEAALGELDLDSGLSLSGDDGPSSSRGSGKIDPLEVAASAPSGAIGLMGLMSKGRSGGESDISEVAATLAGDEGSGAMGGIAEFVMGMVYPDLRTAFVEGTRRITVTISWNEGNKEHAIEVGQWVVDARAAGLRAEAEGEFDEVDEGAASDAAGSGATPGGSGKSGSGKSGSGKSGSVTPSPFGRVPGLSP